MATQDKPRNGEIKVGQMWRDLDTRSAVDEFTVVAIAQVPGGEQYAIVRRDGYAHGRPRETRIKIARLLAPVPEGRRSGYVYIGMKR